MKQTESLEVKSDHFNFETQIRYLTSAGTFSGPPGLSEREFPPETFSGVPTSRFNLYLGKKCPLILSGLAGVHKTRPKVSRSHRCRKKVYRRSSERNTELQRGTIFIAGQKNARQAGVRNGRH